jgi:hypothetical protein
MNETNTAMKARDDTNRVKRGLPWYLWDVPLLGVLLLFGIVENGFSVISYIGGLRNDGSLAFGAVLWFVLLLPLAGIFLLLVLARILVFWPGHVRDRKKLRKLQVGVILGLVIYLGLPFTGLLPPGYKTHTWGFRKHVGANVDVHAIQQWLGTVDPNACADGPAWTTEWRAQRADWPEPVMRMNPQSVTLALDGEGRPTIRLAWSGLDEFWGLAVGHAQMEIPQTQARTKEVLPGGRVSYDNGEYRLPVAPGAYVWHNIELSDGARTPTNNESGEVL